MVLIIGILAAVALPQYQKAVLKSRSARLLTYAKHFNETCALNILEGGTCATLQDINWGYTLDDYEYDEELDQESGKIAGTFVEHHIHYFTAHDGFSNLSIYVDAKQNEIYCVSMGRDPKIEKICETMGGVAADSNSFYATLPNSFYRL